MKTLVNFREIGGLRAATGQSVKTGKLFRSGELVNLDPTDIKQLKAHNITQVVDFRTHKELTDSPNDAIDGVVFTHIDILGNKIANAPSFESFITTLTVEQARGFMHKVYTDFITDPAALTGYRQFVQLVIDNPASTLFHCAAGKDRTGFGAALLLKLLGVDDEAIYHDYLLTIESRKAANDKILANYRAKGLGEEQLAAMAAMYTVERGYLEASFDAIAEHYGSFEAFVDKGLGLSTVEIERLRADYLA